MLPKMVSTCKISPDKLRHLPSAKPWGKNGLTKKRLSDLATGHCRRQAPGNTCNRCRRWHSIIGSLSLKGGQ